MTSKKSKDSYNEDRCIYYQKKCRILERQIKDLVFENAALHDEVQYMDQEFIKAKADRKYLLRRLFQHLPMTESQVLQSTQALKALQNTFPGKIPHTILSPVEPGQDPGAVTPVPNKRKSESVSPSARESSKSNSKALLKGRKLVLKAKRKAAPVQDPEYSDDLSKRKRKKPGTASRKKVAPIHLNDRGVPHFPIVLGTLTVYDLGEIVSHLSGFHSERYIWPVGYHSSRLYPSMIDPDHRVQYYCAIKSNGTDPIFEVIPEDESDKPITASTATACHCIILKRLNKARGKDATNTGSGPEFFGFSHSTIQYLIQCLPGADLCEKYQPIKFELATSEQEGECVLTEDNLPRLDLLDRSTLELPTPKKR